EAAIGIDDSFYRVGGDSISAIRLLVLCREAGFELRISDLNNTSTIRSQADRVSTGDKAALSVQNLSVSSWIEDEVRSRLVRSIAANLPFSQADVIDVGPTTPLQRGLISETLQHGNSTSYVLRQALSFGGGTDAHRLHRAMKQLVKSTPILRTLFFTDSDLGIIQFVIPQGDLPEVTLFKNKAQMRSHAKKLMADSTLGHPMSRPFHCEILTTPSDGSLLIWIIHHALYDGWTMSLLEGWWKRYYAEEAWGVTESNPPFAPIARYLHQQTETADQELWKSYLAGAASLQLPQVAVPERTVRVSAFTESQTDVAKLSRQIGVAPSAMFLASISLALQGMLNCDDIAFGLILSGRTLPVRNIERTAGPCINTTIFRQQLQDSEAVGSLLEGVQGQLDHLNENGHIGLAEAGRLADIDAASIARTLVEFDSIPGDTTSFTTELDQDLAYSRDDVLNEVLDMGSTALTLTGSLRPDGTMHVSAEAHSCHFTKKQISRLVQHIATLVDHLVAAESSQSVASLSMVNSHEQEELLEFAPSGKPLKLDADLAVLPTVHDLIEAKARAYPKKIALVENMERFITYEEVSERSTMVCQALQANGVKPRALVPISFEKSIEVMVAMVAILKAGAAYVPIDPSHPETRKSYIADKCQASVVLVDSKSQPGWPKDGRTVLQLEANGEILQSRTAASDFGVSKTDLVQGDPAYIIFTSGSTGLPKGVVVDHNQIVPYLLSAECQSDVPVHGRRLNFSSISFDTSVSDIMGSLTNGGCLCIASQASMLTNLAAAAESSLATTLCLTASVSEMLITTAPEDGLSWVMSCSLGGEPVKADLGARLSLICKTLNAYGPTEASVENCNVVYDPTRFGSGAFGVPIGRPVGANRLYVLAPDSEKLVGIGCVGELCIGGPQVATGYLGDPVKTDSKFVRDPFVDGGRMFRTGDYAMWREDGLIDCLGRIDGQVKIRGLRIETGEIESAIMSNGTTVKSKVLKMKLADEVDRLVGFVVLHGD
ncbi:hypothetical protein A4X13_0g8713, partial [Tilletia indica]